MTEINYSCNGMQVILKYKYNLKTCMYDSEITFLTPVRLQVLVIGLKK